MRRALLLAVPLWIVALLFFPVIGEADGPEEQVSRPNVPFRYGLALVCGNSYTPRSDVSFTMLSGFALFDYDKVWHHPAPDPLRFKVECAFGTAAGSVHGPVASAAVLALYYPRWLSSPSFRLFVEAGIGGIYTEFRLKGQGLHLNFNPQAGAGVEFGPPSNPFFSAVRLHHISNGGLHHDNRGINSVALSFGRFFK